MIFRILFLMLFAVNVFAAPPVECDDVTCIELTWDTPLEREDGSLINAIDGYDIAYDIDGVEQEIIEIEGEVNSHYLIDVSPANFDFKIRTVEQYADGTTQAGRYSPVISTNIVSRAAWPSMTVSIVFKLSSGPGL